MVSLAGSRSETFVRNKQSNSYKHNFYVRLDVAFLLVPATRTVGVTAPAASSALATTSMGSDVAGQSAMESDATASATEEAGVSDSSLFASD